MEPMPVPSLFKCPISLEMMEDPVTLCTGVTYDRENIQRWFQEGHFTCPYTMQTLDTLDLTPNHTLRRLIQGWCFSNPGHCTGNISPKDPANDKQIEQVLLSISNTPTHLGILRNLADLAKKSERNRAFIVASGGTSVLSSTLCRTRNEADIICGEEVLAVLASLPIHQAEEKCIASLKSSITIDAICWFFCKGSVRARLHSAQILHGLLASDDNFKAIFKPDKEIWGNLNFLLRYECPEATKTGLEIVLIISPVRRNRIRAVEAGVAVTLIEILPKAERNIAEKALAVLEILCQIADGRASVCEHPLGIPVLAKKLARVSELATEAATGALWQIFKNCGNPFVLKKMEEAGAYPKLFLVLQIGSNSITRQKAKEIVKAQKDRSRKNNPCCVVTHQLNAGTFKFEDIHVAKLNA